MKNFGYLIASVIVLFSTNSFASGLFLEPAVTYQTGTDTVHYPSPFSDSDETVRGYGLGLRAGVHLLDTVFVALDGRYARPTYDSSALNGKADATASNLGLTVGAQTPFLGLRVWGTYIFNGQLNPDQINNVDVKFNDFNGYRVGAGFYIAVVSLNLEYQHGHYGSTTIENAGGFTPGSTNDITANDNSYIFSVSFPLAL